MNIKLINANRNLLKPCLFCGEKKDLYLTKIYGLFGVYCTECHYLNYGYKKPLIAINEWNARELPTKKNENSK